MLSLPLQVYVLKRPHVDEFLQRMGQLFECVLFTASLAKVGPAPSPECPAPPPLPPVKQPFVKVGEAVSMVTGSHPRWGGCRPCAQHQPERLLGYHSDSTGNKCSMKLLPAAAEATYPQTREPHMCPV